MTDENYTYVTVAESDELPEGERLLIDIGRDPVLLLRLLGRVFAIADVCSHDGNPLGDGDLDGCAIICPRHGARFDVRNGKALCLPAIEDIPVYPVRETEGKIQIGIAATR